MDSWGGVNDHPMYCDHEWAIVRALSLSGFKRGRDWDFGRMNDDHPVFHCFFDFEGPPVGGFGGPRRLDKRMPQQVPYPDTVSIEGRVMVIFSHYWYSAAWCGQWYEYWYRDNTPQLQFGVNLLVFALTQEGGITRRVMDTFRGY